MATANPMKSYRRYKGGRARVGGSTLLRVILALILVAVLAFAILLGVVLAGSRDDINGDPQVMVILGYQLSSDGTPSEMLIARLDTAMAYLESHPGMTVVVTGGKGSNEVVSEAKAMADYLIACGLLEEQILLEDRATSTYENMLYTMEMLTAQGYDADGDVVVVSNGFHLARARMLWNRVCGDKENLSTLAAPCGDFKSTVWMHVREPLVFAKDFLTRR